MGSLSHLVAWNLAGRIPPRRAAAWPLGKIPLVAAIIVAGFLAAGCGQSGGGAIKSAIASISASRPPASSATAPAVPSGTGAAQPTTAPAVPVAPSTAQAVTNPPSAVTSATVLPAAGTEPTSPLLWLWLGLGALVFIGLIAWISHASSRRKAARSGWQSQVIDAYAKGAALQDAMSTAEAPGAVVGPDAGARWSDIQRRADDLNQTLYAMREAAPGEEAHAAVVDVLTSLQAVRSAMDAERVPGGAGGAQAEVVRQRLLAFEMSLRALRSPDDRQL